MNAVGTPEMPARPLPFTPTREPGLRRLSPRARVIAAASILTAALAGAGLSAVLTGDDQPDVKSIPAVAQGTLSASDPGAGASPDAERENPDSMTPTSADVQSLLATSVGSDDLDTSTQQEWNNVYFTHFIMDPGGSYSTANSDVTASDGIMAYSVVSGELTVKSEGEVLFIPEGSTDASREHMDGPAEFVAAPGDSFVASMDTVLEVSNGADDPAVYVGAFLFNLSDGIMGNNLPQGYFDAVEQYAIGKADAPLPDGPITWLLDAITVEPGGSIAFTPPAGGNSVALVTQGSLRYSRTGLDGAPLLGLSDTILVGPRGIELFVGADQVVVLSNESADPAQLFLFRFGPGTTAGD
ncbi:MAG: hypothetical protein AB7V46_04015 [Thermomicrobiales bacterium]